MPVNNWKHEIEEYGLPEDDIDWDELDIDEDEIAQSYEEIFGAKDLKLRCNMKNIFVNSRIKKQKFSKELVDKIKFGSIKEIMNIADGEEAYLGAYSDAEFFAYRFQKIHNFYPDLLKIKFIKPEKFIEQLFSFIEVPKESYYKSYEDERGKITLNVAVFAFNVGREDQLYMFMDDDEVMFFYNSEYEKDVESTLYLLISLLKGYVEPKTQKNKIYVVYQSQHGFEKTGFDVKKINVDLTKNYNDGFDEVSAEIITGLNDRKKTNLVILSGEPGTGKTTYIRYLTSKIKKNIIFIAPDMVNHITDPSFIPFLIKNNDAVLIIEDAEPALQSRDGNGRTGAVSNVLNLTDGLLSDCLNISIVATFNTTGKNIDSALLRKGRLLKNYKFDKLSIEKSQVLLDKLEANIKATEPMTLADIYFHADDNNSEDYKVRRIGF